MEEKKPKYFPMFVDISNWRILVVGGGKIAARRINTLSHFASDITVIAPSVEDSVRKLRETGKICLEERHFQEQDISEKEWDMVLTATDNSQVNEKIVLMCRERNIPVNRSDCKEMCDFYFPSIIESDGVVIGINSGGADPGKVKRMRKEIEAAITQIEKIY